MNAIPAPLPSWERRYPGRQAYERAELGEHAHNLRDMPNDRSLWQLEFDWALSTGEVARLRAVFPDTYPATRPIVTLLGGIVRPERHISPDGVLCLLGRESRQWTPDWTLAQLLNEQLERALHQQGPEDPQGEPAEFWWNHAAGHGNYCLIDSDWAVGDVERGTLDLRLSFQREASGWLTHAYMASIIDEQGREIVAWTSALPPSLVDASTLRVPWVRLDSAPLPFAPVGDQLRGLIEAHRLRWLPAKSLTQGVHGRAVAFCYPSELEQGHIGNSWLVLLETGKGRALRPQARGGQAAIHRTLLPTLRAGATDLQARAPQLRALANCKVVVVGVGAIGAPVAVELARIGVKQLDLIEGDILEPGNSVRWPLGASHWGLRKPEALRRHLAKEYPGTRIHSHERTLGSDNTSPDGQLLDELLERADLVIDASVAFGISQWLSERCRRANRPFVQAFATPTLEGGCVVLLNGDACLVCLEHRWLDRSIEPPDGDRAEPLLIQPPGCSERTFLGEGVDLQEISLQVVRLAVQQLSQPLPHSVVQTVSLQVEGMRLPRWRSQVLTAHPDCSCR